MPNRIPPALLLLIAGLAACQNPRGDGRDRSSATETDRPNLVFVFADDHAFQAISAYDGRLNRTPNLDRLADEGMRFDRCFVGNSICAPARATVLTGLHSHANGVIDNRAEFDGSQRTMPKLLQAAGYQTALVGKWHLKSEPTGFDHWEVLIGQGPYYNPPLRTPQGVVRHEGYTTEIITARALRWLREERDPARPFLLMMQHKAPHREWQPGPRELHLFEGVDIPEPPTLFDDWSGRASPAAAQEMTVARHLSPLDLKLVPPGKLTPQQLATWQAAYGPRNDAYQADPPSGEALVRWQYQRYLKSYLRSIEAVDRSMGELLDELERAGLAEDTVVIYSSDQGFYLGEHGWYDKRWMYEESFRTPLLVRWPGAVEPGSVNAELSQNIDFAPTLLELAGVEPPADLHGRSLVPLLRGERPADWRRSLYYHYYEFPGVHAVARHRGVRTDRHKLIHYYQTGEWELFDLERDPMELQSVHADPAYAALRAELEAELERLAEHYGESDYARPREDHYRAWAQSLAAQVEPAERLRLERPATGERRMGSIYATPLSLGLFTTPERAAADGVLVAHGGASFGYSLHLRAGHAVITVRDDEARFEVADPEPLPAGRETHLAFRLAADGRLELWRDGVLVAAGVARVVGLNPSDGFAIGMDPGSPVGDYAAPNPYSGEVRQLRLWAGALPEATIASWAVAREPEGSPEK